jgi:predicted ATPase
MEQRFPLWEAYGRVLRGWALAAQGQREEGIIQMRRGHDAWQATGAEVDLPYYRVLLAEVYGNLGQITEGLELLAAAAPVVDKGERYWEAEIYRLKGELLLARPAEQHAEAEVCLHQALEVARCQQAKSLELRAALSLSRLWQHQGKHAAAHELLAPLYAWFTEGFDTADLQEAKAWLAVSCTQGPERGS